MHVENGTVIFFENCIMYSLEVRYKAVVHYKYFLKSVRKIAKIYNVSKSTVQRWIHQDLSGQKTKKNRPRKKPLVKSIQECVDKELSSNPFLSMHSLSKILQANYGLSRTTRTVGRYVKQLGWTLKKAFRTVNCKHDSQSIKTFCDSFLGVTDDDIVCIDEAGFYVGETRRSGYAKRGKRLKVLASPSLRCKKFTLIMAISKVGIKSYKILDHNCKKADFIQFIKDLDLPRGKVLLMDNIMFHHSKETREAVQIKGFSQLFIPKYSPKFNAIENVFSTVKGMYRKLCPPSCDPGFDYKAAMKLVLSSDWNFSNYYRHIRNLVQQTHDAIIDDPEYIFSGYDE